MKQVMFGAGWTLAVALLALPAHADCQKNTVEFPVQLVEGRPIAMVTLNGVDIPMLVDSGAFFNMLPASTARQLKLPAYDLPTSYRVSGFAGTPSVSVRSIHSCPRCSVSQSLKTSRTIIVLAPGSAT